jgi:glycolate oxidase FAD binding subunit
MDAVAQFQDRIRAAAADSAPLCIRGGGSKSFYGGAQTGQLLDTRSHSGIVQYEPSELVVTVRAGTPLAELEAALAEKRQMLAFEPPHFGAATVGGMVAAGLSGPRRATAGTVRDHLLGVRLIDGRGDAMRFGGEVMKNVAGYDVSRLMAGAMGTLGLLTEVSLKVLPVPAAERTIVFSMNRPDALRAMNRWACQPLPISATCWHADTLHVRLSGAIAAVEAATRNLGGEAVDEPSAKQLWTSVREQTHPFFADGDDALWRVSLCSAEENLIFDLPMLIEWGGALRWVRAPVDDARVRSEAHRQHGFAMRFRTTAGVQAQDFEPLPGPLAEIHRRIRQAFDPAGIFNPQRLPAIH